MMYQPSNEDSIALVSTNNTKQHGQIPQLPLYPPTSIKEINIIWSTYYEFKVDYGHESHSIVDRILNYQRQKKRDKKIPSVTRNELKLFLDLNGKPVYTERTSWSTLLSFSLHVIYQVTCRSDHSTLSIE